MLSRLFRSRADQATPASFECLEPRAMMAADLTIAVGGLQTVPVNGATNIRVPVTITNRGNTTLSGGGNVEFYLSKDRVLDDSDFLFNTRPLPKLGRPGTAARFTLDTPMPANLAPAVGRPLAAGDYFVIARVAPTKPASETNKGNNVAATTGKATVSYDFGTVGEKTGVGLTLTLSNGDIVRLSIDGPGSGTVVNVDNRLTVVIDGVNTQSSLILTPVKGSPTLHGLVINGNLKNILGSRVNIDGDIDVAGAVGTVVLGDVSNSNFILRGFGPNWGASLGNVTNTTITSNFIPLRGLHVNQWVDSDPTLDTITVPYMESLTSNGDFAASPVVNASHKGFAIEKVEINGTLRKGAWNIANAVETVKVGAIAADWGGTIRGEVSQFTVGRNLSGTLAVANLRRLVVGGSIVGANILVGARLGSDGRLGGTGAAQDTFQAGAIGIIDVRGSISNSVIAAGLSTTDATLLDEDDRVIQGGFINSVTVAKSVTNSSFVAEKVPARVRINGRTVTTANDARFIRSLPRT